MMDIFIPKHNLFRLQSVNKIVDVIQGTDWYCSYVEINCARQKAISSLHIPTQDARRAHLYSAGLRAERSGVRFPVGAGNFTPHHRVHTFPETHKDSYTKSTRSSFPGTKAAEAW